MKTRIKLLIFDLDGTLVDSIQDITDAINHAIVPLGYRPVTTRTLLPLVGQGITRLIERLLKSEPDSVKKQALDSFIDYYSTHLTVHTRAFPSVRDTLNRLNNYKMAVVSNKRESFSRRILEELGLIHHFCYIIGSDTLNEKKPSAVPVRYLLQREGLTPAQAVMIGDSEIDIQTARNASIPCIAVTYGYRELQHLRDADYIINSFSELPSLLQQLDHLS